jgi:hypothetical protein
MGVVNPSDNHLRALFHSRISKFKGSSLQARVRVRIRIHQSWIYWNLILATLMPIPHYLYHKANGEEEKKKRKAEILKLK